MRQRLPIFSLLLSLGWAALLVVDFPALWAFRFLVYVPTVLRWGMALLVVLAWAAALWQLPLRIPALPLRWRAVRWIGLPVALALFWLAREQTYHGDALLKLQLLSTQTLQSDPYVWKEPLDSLLAYGTTSFLRGWHLAADTAIALLSSLAGLLYIAAVGYVAMSFGTDGWSRGYYALGLLAVGSSQLWFGHVENYSWVTAMAFATVALAVGYLQGRNSLWPVGLTAGLAVSLHPQAAFMLPALVLLLDRRWPQQLVTLLISGLIGPLLTVAALWVAGTPWPNFANGYAGDPQLFWHLDQAVQPAQLMDVWNNLWLIAPLAPLWLVAGIGSLRTAGTDPRLRYLTGVAGGLLLYLLFFQNDLPRPQDWDLFAIVGPGVTLWGLVAWRHWDTRQWTTITLPALAFATCFTVAWISVNHHYTIIRPNADQRAIYERYRLLDLTTLLPSATIIPSEPLCAEPTGCERVAITEFTMPQDGDARPTIFAHAPARIQLPLTVPQERSFLWLSPALDPTAWGWGGDGVTFRVLVAQAGKEQELWSRHLSPSVPADLDWQEAFVALDDFRGQTITLILATEPGPANDNAGDRAGWGLPWLMRGTREAP